MKILTDFFRIFYPELCANCDNQLTQNEEVLCTFCRHDLPLTNYADYSENKITKADANAKTVYVHRIAFNTKTKKTTVNSELVSITNETGTDKKVDNIVQKWNVLLNEKLKEIIPNPEKIIYSAVEPLDGRDTPVRSTQTNLGGLITKAMAQAFDNKVDCALLNGGSIRIDDQLHGEVSMYCSVTASYSILFDLLNRFRQTHPGIEIKLHTGDPEHAIARIIAGEEDITIAAHPPTLPRSLAFKPIIVSPLLFIAPTEQRDPDVPLTAPLSREEWASVPMILSEGGIARSRIDTWFRKMDVNPRIYAQVAGNEAIVSMVSLGLGIGVVPKIVLDNSPLKDKVQIVSDAEQTIAGFEIGLAVLNKERHDPALNAIWSIAQSLTQQAI